MGHIWVSSTPTFGQSMREETPLGPSEEGIGAHLVLGEVPEKRLRVSCLFTVSHLPMWLWGSAMAHMCVGNSLREITGPRRSGALAPTCAELVVMATAGVEV